MIGATDVKYRGETITHYRCNDCGCVTDPLKKNTLRPNNKFCDTKCMMYVLETAQLVPPLKRPRNWRKWVESMLKEREK